MIFYYYIDDYFIDVTSLFIYLNCFIFMYIEIKQHKTNQFVWFFQVTTSIQVPNLFFKHVSQINIIITFKLNCCSWYYIIPGISELHYCVRSACSRNWFPASGNDIYPINHRCKMKAILLPYCIAFCVYQQNIVVIGTSILVFMTFVLLFLKFYI